MKYANNSVLTQKIMPLADAMSAYNSSLKQKRSGEDNWMPDVVKTPHTAISNPRENEIGYPSFVGVLVSLAIVGRDNLSGQNPIIAPSKTAVPTKSENAGHNREFNVKTIQVTHLKALFDAINVMGGVMSKPKRVEKVKPPQAPSGGTGRNPDYLREM